MAEQKLNADEMKKAGYLKLGDKWYAMVATRIREFRTSPKYAGWQIITTPTHGKVSIIVKAEIINARGTVMATGHSEKPWRDGKASRSEGVERTETAAIGRALATLGLLADHGIASFEEVGDSMSEELSDLRKVNEKLLRQTMILRECLESAARIRWAMKREKWDVAVEAFEELTEQQKIDLFAISTRDGGIWSTWERTEMKQGEGIVAARRVYYNREEQESVIDE
jgi:hypothetical protein